MSVLKVHPVADLFPMLADDELAELAADIKQRGLMHPIVLDGPDGWLLDGRNRLAACEIAGVEAEFAYYDESDPIGYILAANINRRHLTKGQQAMVIAAADNDYQESARSAGVSRQYVSWARTVLKYAEALKDTVISGAMPLKDAYEEALQNKRKSEGAEAQLVQLRAEDPELADKVVEGELTLKGAWAELAERQRKRAEEQRDARALLRRIVELAAPEGAAEGFGGAWAERLGDHDAELTVLIKRAEEAGHVLLDLAERVRQ